MSEKEFINNLSMKEPNTFKKIYNKIIELANKITGKSSEKLFIRDLKNKWEEAYRAQENNLNGNMYSQETLNDGTTYVKTENDLFNNSDGTPMTQKEIYKNLIGKQIVLNDGITVTIEDWLPGNKNMYNELFKRYPTYQNIPSIKSVNNTINKNITELLETSGNVSANEPDYNSRHSNNKIDTFDTRKVSFYDGKNAYDLDLSIAKMLDGKYVAYAKRNLSNNSALLNKIKKEAPMSKSQGVLPYVDNISQSNENVKSDTSSTKYSMQESKNNTQELGNSSFNLKEKQLNIILKENPMLDDYHTGIRKVEDIKTLQEMLQDSDYEGYDEFNPDLTRQDIENAIDSGKITVYSSYPIEQGIFISPSRMEAESYSGNGKIYSKKVSINDVAWIDPTQGQYAKVDTKYSQNNPTWQEHLENNYKSTGTITNYSDIVKQIEKISNDIKKQEQTNADTPDIEFYEKCNSMLYSGKPKEC